MAGVDPKVIGKRVKEARGRARLTQADLAEAAGVTDETVSRIERGAYEPALSTAVAFSDALGVPLAWLATARAEGPPVAPASPLFERLAATARALEPEALRALVRMAEVLAARPAGRKPRPR